MNISMEAVYIAIHENALDEMRLAEARIGRRMERVKEEYYVLEEDLHELREQILEKEAGISAARDRWLVGGCV